MKLLLDESIPRRLVESFPDDYEVTTVPRMGWAGARNGELLTLAADHSFSALITADRGMEHQQNVATLPLSIVVLIAHRTRLQDLQPLVPQVIELLSRNRDIGVYRVAA